MLTEKQKDIIKKFQDQKGSLGFTKAEHAVLRRTRRELALTLVNFYGDTMPEALKLYIELNGDLKQNKLH